MSFGQFMTALPSIYVRSTIHGEANARAAAQFIRESCAFCVSTSSA
jgi:hypothetical protein